MEPPILLKLAEGEGPVNICANHIVTEEDDMDMDDEDDEEMEVFFRWKWIYNIMTKLKNKGCNLAQNRFNWIYELEELGE